MEPKKASTLIRVTYFTAFFADALFTPFLALYFLSVGLSKNECGILLAIVPFATFFGNYFYAFLLRRGIKPLFLMRLLSLFEGIVVLAIGFISQFWGLLVLLSFFSLNNSPYFQIQDSYSAGETKRWGKSFYSIRIFGSLAYATALLLGYFLLKNVDYRSVFVISSVFFFVDFALTFFLHESGNNDFPQRDIQKKNNFLSNRHLVLYVIFYVLVFGSLSIGSYVLPIHLKELGLADNEYSAFNGLRVLCEILAVFLSTKIEKWLKGSKNSLIVSSVLFLLSSLVVVCVKGAYPIVIANYLLRGFGGGLFIVSSVHYVQTIVGDSALSKGLTISAGTMNLFVGLGNLASPYLYDSWSFPFLFGILALFQGIGLIFLIVSPKTNEQHNAPVIK